MCFLCSRYKLHHSQRVRVLYNCKAHPLWKGRCIYIMHEIIITIVELCVCACTCKSWLYDLGSDQLLIFLNHVVMFMRLMRMFYSLGAKYKYSVSCLPFSAGLCGLSFLNNQDGKSFYFILYIYIYIYLII